MPSFARLARVSTAGCSVLPLLLIAACSGGKMSAEKANAAVIVEVGGAKLTGSTLSAWLSQAPSPPNELAAALLVSTWLDQTLLDQAQRKGMALDDSLTVDEAIAPDAVRGMLLDFWAVRAKARPAVTDAQADSLSSVDKVRVFQQLFIPLPNTMDSASAAPIVAKIRAVAIRAHEPTADFTALIRENVKDSMILARDGFMPATTRSELPKQVADAIWALRPGEVSGVIGSSGGGHLFRRATRNESRPGMKVWLAPALALRAEQRFTDSISAALGLKLSSDAVVRVRAMAPEPIPVIAGGPLATWQGGELSGARVRSWVSMLAPNERVLLATSSDSGATRYLRELAQREILLVLTSPAGAPNAEARASLGPQYRTALDSAKTRLQGVAAGKSEAEVGVAYVDAILQQRVFYRPLPGNLAGILRQRFPATINQAALDGVVSAANATWREKHAKDTAGAAQQQVPRPGALDGMVPVPGAVPAGTPPTP